MSYEDYTIDEFLADEYFQQWILRPSAESKSFWETWLHQHPDKAAVVEQARHMLLVIATKEKEGATQEKSTQLWQKIQHSIHRKPSGADNGKKYGKQPRRAFVPAWKQWAAGIAALGLLYYFFFFQKINSSDVYATAFQQTKNIELPDGSTVILNANSTLQVATQWDANTPREVWLRGEAFFEVQKLNTHQENAKFIVHTNHLDVEVLGTKFNVNDRHDKAQVVLNSGSVKLKMEQNEVTMLPGEMIEFSRKEKAFQKKTVDPEVYSAWKDHKIIFQETPVSEVLQRLKNTYGLEVTLHDTSLLNREYTGTFEDPDPEIILKTLAVTFDLEVIYKDDQVILE